MLQNLKSPAGNNYRFRTLFEVALLVLITPHSNAGIERVYSLVNKNRPEGSERNRLDIDASLSSILAVKPRGGGGDYIYFPDTDVPRENQRRAQTGAGFLANYQPISGENHICYKNATQSRGNLVSVQIDILFGA